MVAIRLNVRVLDFEIGLLTKILALLDVELDRVNAAVSESRDPESDGLCELGEFLVGSGFVAMQRYINATRVDLEYSKDAYDRPPMFNANVAIVSAINAISNCWKHSPDWDEIDRNGGDPGAKGSSASTIKVLVSMGDLGEYPCANALARMAPRKALALSNLLPLISEWRESLLTETRRFNLQD